MSQEMDLTCLPLDIREKLAELDLELSEGDITQKGYEKKRARLLAPFVKIPSFIPMPGVGDGGPLKESQHVSRHQQMMKEINSPGVSHVQDVPGSPMTRAKRRHHRRVTRHESRYHSEVRQEAVQQAIAAMKNKPGKAVVPMPSKRSSHHEQQAPKSRGRHRGSRRDPSDSSSDDDSTTTTGNNDSFSDQNDHTFSSHQNLRNHNHHHRHHDDPQSHRSHHHHDKSSKEHQHHREHRHSNQQQQYQQQLFNSHHQQPNQQHHQQHHQQKSSHQQSQQVLKQYNYHHKSGRNMDDSPPPLPTSSRPTNVLSRSGSSTETSDPSPTHEAQVCPPSLPPRVTSNHKGHHSKSAQPPPDYSGIEGTGSILFLRERNDGIWRQHHHHKHHNKSKHERHERHEKHEKHEKNQQQFKVSDHKDHKDHKKSSREQQSVEHFYDDNDDGLVEETPHAPPRMASQQPKNNKSNSRQENESNIKHQNYMNNNKIHSKNSNDKKNINILSNQACSSGSSSTEKPPERSSSKSTAITLNQFSEVMPSSRERSQSLESPTKVTQNITGGVNPPPPLPPRLVSPSTSHHVSLEQTRQHHTSTSTNSNNSGHSCATPAPDYDPVYEHDNNAGGGAHLDSSRINDSNPSLADDSSSVSGTTSRYKVSAKIQQLLVTLSRPKKRPLHDFYVDDETDLEIAANQPDPSAPKPEGQVMSPVVGETLSFPAGLPKSLEDALSRYGSATFKAPAVTVLDTSGKVHPALTYGKLYNRSRKIAYNLLNKIGHKSSSSSSAQTSSSDTATCSGMTIDATIKQGDRVALVFPNSDPFGFMCAFYGCLLAGVVPVPIEVPISKRDAGSTQIGFLLGSCCVSYAITSEACFKGLPKNASTGELMPDFKAWPKLTWLVPDGWSKPPKDWKPPPRISDQVPAYIEYTVDKDGSMKGVSISRANMMSHCLSLTSACCYTEGDIMVSVLDFKRDVGLWHSVLTSILNGMHILFIPYSLMKVNPSSWMLMITKFKATVAICKSRDLHWGLLATRDHKDVNLSSLRMLLVADGSNPWSLSSCDQFINVFNSRGLKPEAVCPCASSPEALTVSVRRPGRTGVGATGRGVLSMSALSHGVIRVDQENSLTSLTLQDCGHILPSATAAVVKINGPPVLCKTDEVGEICVSTHGSGGSSYWGLLGMTNSIFKATPLADTLEGDTPATLKDGTVVGSSFVRTGLLGFMGPGSLVFICGSRDGLMQVSGRKHNTDDLIATVLAVEPMKFVYRGRIAIFSIRVLRDERICVIAEQRPDCTEEESFQWMSRVLQAVDSIHSVGIYCLALVPPNQLPKTPLGGIHLAEVKRRFLEGSLHPANVLMCPHTCVTNLPKPREAHPRVGPASVMVGNIVQGNRLAVAQGRELPPAGTEDDPSMNDLSDFGRKYQYLSEILKWRATSTPEHDLFTLINRHGNIVSSLTCAGLYKRAERVACFLLEKGLLNTGDYVALIYPPGIDLIIAFYGCLFLGVVPVTVRPPHPGNLTTTLPTVKMIVDVSKAVLILSTGPVIKLLKSKEAANVVEPKSWVPTFDTDDLPKKKLTSIYRAPTPEMIAYLDFSVSTTGMLAGMKMSHAAASSICRSMKLACELYPSRHVALCLDPYCGLGFVLWVLNSIYSGHHSFLMPPSEVEQNPAVWLSVVSQNKVRDTFISYGVMELCNKGLSSPTAVQNLKGKGINLSCVRTCVAVAEERPRVNLTTSFSKLFSTLGLSPRAVSTSFGCRVNVGLCLQGASSPDPTTVYVDMRALRNDRVTLVERGAPHSLPLIESGKLLPGVKVVIANPETKGHCGDSNLGEIWVQSPFNSSGYFNIYGDESLHNEHFQAKLTTGDTTQTYARTGYLGFLRRTESVQADGELHDAVFVVGSLDETVMLRGMRYHPIDIENSVLRSHKKMSECAVFTWTNLLVVVSELEGSENEALDLVPLITNVVLEDHHLIVGVVVVVDPGIIPINSRGEKQRMHLRDGFLADQLDPIYVAYNM